MFTQKAIHTHTVSDRMMTIDKILKADLPKNSDWQSQFKMAAGSHIVFFIIVVVIRNGRPLYAELKNQIDISSRSNYLILLHEYKIAVGGHFEFQPSEQI